MCEWYWNTDEFDIDFKNYDKRKTGVKMEVEMSESE